MSRRAIASVLGAAALLAASVAGASSASALVSGATAPDQPFGDVAVHTTVQQVITVTATGEAVTFGATPTIEQFGSAVGQDADYSVVSETCGGHLVAADSSCSVTVQFQPFAVGLRQAVLRVVSTTPPADLLVNLSGTGTPDATGTYYPLASPTRFLDTGTASLLPKNTTTTVAITNRAGIPASGVSAVVINLTADKTGGSGYFTAYPSGTARPKASSLNFPKGWTGANMVTVPVGADGKISLYNANVPARLIVDVAGWYAKDDSVRVPMGGIGAQFLSTASGDPERIYDSRDDPVNSDLPFQGGDYIEFTDTWDSEATATAVKAYAVTITAVNATASGVLTAWAGGVVPKPTASTVNYTKGTIAPNMSVVPAGHYGLADTGFRIQDNSSGSVHIVVDITGYYVADDSAGMRFKPIAPAAAPRILDTRPGGTGLSGAFVGGVARTAPASNVSSADSLYLVGNVTGVAPTKSTFLTIWSGASALPVVSNLNVNAGAIRAVSAYAPLRENTTGPARTYNLYVKAGSMHVLYDVAGTLDLYPSSSATAAAGASRLSATGDRRAPDQARTATSPERTDQRRG